MTLNTIYVVQYQTVKNNVRGRFPTVVKGAGWGSNRSAGREKSKDWPGGESRWNSIHGSLELTRGEGGGEEGGAQASGEGDWVVSPSNASIHAFWTISESSPLWMEAMVNSMSSKRSMIRVRFPACRGLLTVPQLAEV